MAQSGVATPVHVLVVLITLLLFAVVARVALSVVRVGSRVAALHPHELPVVQEPFSPTPCFVPGAV